MDEVIVQKSTNKQTNKIAIKKHKNKIKQQQQNNNNNNNQKQQKQEKLKKTYILTQYKLFYPVLDPLS